MSAADCSPAWPSAAGGLACANAALELSETPATNAAMMNARDVRPAEMSMATSGRALRRANSRGKPRCGFIGRYWRARQQARAMSAAVYDLGIWTRP
jgi:hypothetical protein